MVASCRIAVAASLVLVAKASLLPFGSFTELYGRSYQAESSEFQTRKELYEQRVTDAEHHNSNPDRLWTAGVNKLWDWTDSELQTLRGWDGSMTPAGGSTRAVRKHAMFLQQASKLPKEKIWADLATAQKVKNQGACGSCWAIAAATVLEAHVEIFSGKPRTFSVQQIVACTPNPRHCGGDGGCHGATVELAMEWVLKHGAAEESQVPYNPTKLGMAELQNKTGKDGACPSLNPSAMTQLVAGDGSAAVASGGSSFGMTGWEMLPKNEYEPLVRALAERGPVGVSVAAAEWFSYESGIFNGCGKDSVITHAVVAMGYGEDNGHKYWLLQNSWGRSWGEEGRIRLERHDANDHCGTNTDPQQGTGCKGETAPVPVCGMCGVLFDSVVPHFG